MRVNCPACGTSQVIEGGEADQKTTLRCKQCGILFRIGEEAESPLELEELDLDALLIPPENQGLQPEQTLPALEELPPISTQEDAVRDGVPPGNQAGPGFSELQDLSLDLNLDLSVTEAGKSSNLPHEDSSPNANLLELTPLDPREGPETGASQGTSGEELSFIQPNAEGESPMAEGSSPDSILSEDPMRGQPLASCCIESLTLGRDTCYICGRKLDRKAPEVEEELRKIQTQQIRDRMRSASHTISFSKAKQGIDMEALSGSDSLADFSDLEKALDALAEAGTGPDLQTRVAHLIKRKGFLVQGGIVLATLLGLGVLAKIILPSGHEKLMKQYHQVMAKEEPSPEEMVELGLVAAKDGDKEVLNLVSVLPNFPKISGGKLLSVDNPYDQQDLGNLIQKRAYLEQTIQALEGQIDAKNLELKEYESNKVPSSPLKVALEKATKELETMTNELEKKKKESMAKVGVLQQRISTLQEERMKAIQAQKDNIDRVDSIGKALYTSNIQKEKTLTEEIAKAQEELRTAQAEQRKYLSDLEDEYTPKLGALKQKIAETQRQYEMAQALEDPTRSPIEGLKANIDKLEEDVASLKKQLGETEALFKEALAYFKNPEAQQALSSNQNCQFSSLKRDVILNLQGEGSSSGKKTWVLKRYEAQCQGKVFRSPWLISQLK